MGDLPPHPRQQKNVRFLSTALVDIGLLRSFSAVAVYVGLNKTEMLRRGDIGPAGPK